MLRQIWTIFLVQSDSKNLDVKVKVFKKDENKK